MEAGQEELRVQANKSSTYRHYSRELARPLLVRFPPKDGKCYGLTGNFLPIIALVQSNRKFSRLKGWYWTEYCATNVYVKLSERMELRKVDEIIVRLAYRLWTTRVPSLTLEDAMSNAMVTNGLIYITVFDLEHANIFLFYTNPDRYHSLKNALNDNEELRNFKLKMFEFHRFNRRVVNYVTIDRRISSLFFLHK